MTSGGTKLPKQNRNSRGLLREPFAVGVQSWANVLLGPASMAVSCDISDMRPFLSVEPGSTDLPPKGRPLS